MGVEAHGTELKVYVNLDQLDSMDEASESQLKAQALALWKRTWAQAHPHKHAKLTVTLRDYYGNVQYSESTRV